MPRSYSKDDYRKTAGTIVTAPFIDPDALVEHGDGGAHVQAWVWVSDGDVVAYYNPDDDDDETAEAVLTVAQIKDDPYGSFDAAVNEMRISIRPHDRENGVEALERFVDRRRSTTVIRLFTDSSGNRDYDTIFVEVKGEEPQFLTHY